MDEKINPITYGCGLEYSNPLGHPDWKIHLFLIVPQQQYYFSSQKLRINPLNSAILQHYFEGTLLCNCNVGMRDLPDICLKPKCGALCSVVCLFFTDANFNSGAAVTPPN